MLSKLETSRERSMGELNTLLRNLEAKLERSKGELNALLRDLEVTKKAIASGTDDENAIEEAHGIITLLSLDIQAQLEYKIAEVVTLALGYVFPDPYEMKLRFEPKRNALEANIYFTRNDEEIDPFTECGGGVVDVTCFALRVALWSLGTPRSAPVMILDEPFTHVAKTLLPSVSALIKQISSELGLQFIIVTHEEELIDSADKVFRVEMKESVSQVTIEK